MDIKKLQQFVKFAKRNGISHLKVDDIEFHFTADALVPKRRISKKEKEELDKLNKLTPEDMLMWSTQDDGAMNG